MHRVRVLAPQIVGALRELPAEADGAVLRMCPAAVCQEPPIVIGEMSGVSLAQVDAGLVVIRHAREGEQPECPEWK